MSNLKESIFSQFERTHVEISVPSISQPLYCKRLPPDQCESWQFKRLNKQTGKVDYSKLQGARAELVAMCICDADGELVFSSASEVGSKLPNDVVDEMHQRCLEVNHLNAKDAEAAEGNS